MSAPYRNRSKVDLPLQIDLALETPLVSDLLTAEAYIALWGVHEGTSGLPLEPALEVGNRHVRAFFLGDTVVAGYVVEATPRPERVSVSSGYEADELAASRGPVWISRSLSRADRAWIYCAYVLDAVQARPEEASRGRQAPDGALEESVLNPPAEKSDAA